MPVYKVPPPKKRRTGKSNEAVPYDEMGWRRRLTLPVNDAILDAVDIDDNVVIALECTVKALEKRVGDGTGGGERRTLDVVVKAVSVQTSTSEEIKKLFKG